MSRVTFIATDTLPFDRALAFYRQIVGYTRFPGAASCITEGDDQTYPTLTFQSILQKHQDLATGQQELVVEVVLDSQLPSYSCPSHIILPLEAALRLLPQYKDKINASLPAVRVPTA